MNLRYSLQLMEQLESLHEQCQTSKEQSQRLEVALTAAQGKIDLLTADIQTKVKCSNWAIIYNDYDNYNVVQLALYMAAEFKE